MTPKSKKLTRRILVIALLLIVLYIIWSPFYLVKVGNRAESYVPDSELKAQIKADTKGMTADEIRKYSIKKTASLLSFALKNDLKAEEANCVGYAQVGSGICNYAFKENDIKGHATPVVGYVMFYGINVCNVLRPLMPTKRWSNFVKDHDFVEFNYDGKTIYADASTYDLIGKDCATKAE